MFPGLVPPISLSSAVSHWRRNYAPPLNTLRPDPFTLVQMLYPLPIINIPSPWLPVPRNYYIQDGDENSTVGKKFF